MRVLTLHNEAFEAHAARLAGMVIPELPARGFDAVVGVRRGGSIVCDAFCRFLPRRSYGLRTDVSLQRAFTRKKKGMVVKILKMLPIPVLNLLRKAEARILTWRHMHSDGVSLRNVDLPEGLRWVLENEDKPNILVVDDAIDSGDTLFAVINSLKQVNPHAKVKVAVMTVTTKEPRVKADYTLYDNRTLIRFPWSSDYRQNGTAASQALKGDKN